MAARHGAMIAGDTAMVARVEVVMAHFAIAVDEDERAQNHLLSAQALPPADAEWQARAWVARSLLQQRSGGAPPGERTLPDADALAKQPRTRGVAASVFAEFAAWARLRGDTGAAQRHVARCLELAPEPSPQRARAYIEQAEALLLENHVEAARKSYLAAIEQHQTLGHHREEGRAVARYALRVAASSPGAHEVPASLLGRAMSVIGSSATWRDVATSRGGFRIHGRRLQDRAIGGGVAARIDELEEAAARMRATVAAWIDDADRHLGKAARSAEDCPEVLEHLQAVRATLFQVLDDSTEQRRRLGAAAAQVVDVIETTVVERDRMRSLLDILARVDAVTELDHVGPAAAALGSRLLQADNVVLARRSDGGELEAIGRFGATAESIDWRSSMDAHARLPPSTRRGGLPATRSSEVPRGSVLVAWLGGSQAVGALYADKLHRSGRFNEQDHQLAQLFADYFALVHGRLVALNAKHRAIEQLSTTLDTIRDGVLSIDDAGVVRSANAAALRMLRSEAAEVIDRRVADIGKCEPLWELLAGARRVDGSLVRLRHGSFIVTARPVGPQSHDGGVVATLVELDRAQRLAHRVTAARPRYEFGDILGESAPVRRALHVASRAAGVEASVLITGETGTGKEVFAQAIHTGSRRAAEPFVGLNCAAIPRELLEAELFGYERGAFTGARNDGNPGKFELAGEGTVLLDEIGDMPADMQAKLLRVLQERVVIRIGGSAERPVRARVIATTHKDIDGLVRAGRFRLDLLHRLKVLHIHLPPLRDRGADILLLAKAFLDRFANAQGKAVRGMSHGVHAALLGHSWPGNVRELANVMEREVSLLAPDAPVLPALHSSLQATDDCLPRDSYGGDDGTILPLAEVERRTFLRALGLCEGSVSRAAQALGVSKVTFYAKLRGWGMHPRDRQGD